MRHGKDPKAARRSASAWTLRRALDEYLAKRTLKPRSVTYYRSMVEANLRDWLDRPLRSITREWVEDRHLEIKTDIARRRGHRHPDHWQSEPGAHAANKTLGILGSVWNFVERRDSELPRNPVGILRGEWFAEPRRERFVQADQLPAFYQAVMDLDNHVMRDFIRLVLFTGLRMNEAAALRWDEVDFATKVIRLPARRSKTGRKLDLPMSTWVRDLLVARRAIGNANWVFPADSKSGHLTEPGSAYSAIERQTGIRVSSHDLRRTFITIAEACDISPMALKALVNHALGGDVTSGYIQMTSERLRKPAQVVGDRIAELCGLEEPQGENLRSIS
jgi:integrase